MRWCTTNIIWRDPTENFNNQIPVYWPKDIDAKRQANCIDNSILAHFFCIQKYIELYILTFSIYSTKTLKSIDHFTEVFAILENGRRKFYLWDFSDTGIGKIKGPFDELSFITLSLFNLFALDSYSRKKDYISFSIDEANDCNVIDNILTFKDLRAIRKNLNQSITQRKLMEDMPDFKIWFNNLIKLKATERMTIMEHLYSKNDIVDRMATVLKDNGVKMTQKQSQSPSFLISKAHSINDEYFRKTLGDEGYNKMLQKQFEEKKKKDLSDPRIRKVMKPVYDNWDKNIEEIGKYYRGEIE